MVKPVTVEAAPRTRRRNAAATRAAILASARQAFARAGYEGAGVREIAQGAGVTAMMVNRYFGSKENLFAEAIAETIATTSFVMPRIIESPGSSDLIASVLVDITKAGMAPLEGFQIMLRSASSDRAAEIGREQIEKHHQRMIAEALKGEFAPQRAALLLSLIAGFQVMRQMIGLSALSEAEPEDLVQVLGPLLRLLIEGDGSGLPKRS